MSWFTILLFTIYFLVLVVICFALLRPTGFGKYAAVFVEKGIWIYKGSSKILKAILGERIVGALYKLFHWIFFEPNPILQIAYLCLLLGGYYLFIIKGKALTQVPGPFIGGIHILTAHFSFIFTLWLFYKASRADPGIIRPETRIAVSKTFPYDYVVWNPKECYTCLIERPARAKHCPTCNVCVSRFDHHCPWINNCVGENTIKWFHAFLISTFILCFYIAWVTFAIARGTLYTNHPNMFRSDLSLKDNFSYSSIFRMASRPFPTHPASDNMVPVGTFCGICGIFVFGFWLFHIFLILFNTTTYETFKRQFVKADISRYWSRESQIKQVADDIEKLKEEHANEDVIQEKVQKLVRMRKSQKEAYPEPPDERGHTKVANQKGGFSISVKNPYNLGPIRNLKECFWSPNSHIWGFRNEVWHKNIKKDNSKSNNENKEKDEKKD